MSYFNGPKIVNDGLVLCLDAANSKSYIGSGTTWNDLSGNNNTGTLTNGPTYSGGNGGVIITDAVDDYISINDSTSLRLTTGFTVGMWVKFNNAISTSYKNLIGKPTYTKYGIIIEWYGNNPLLADFISTGGGRNTGTGLLYPSLTDWNYVVHSYDKNGGVNNQRFHVWNSGTYNSAYYTTGTLDIETSSDPLLIGGGGASLTISCAWVYNRGINYNEVLQNYNATKGRFGL